MTTENNPMKSIFGNLSVEDFLANYWQKKPLVIRNAFPDFEMPFTAEELAGLALDTDAPSRIIIEHGLAPENKPWQVKTSPFIEEDFTTLPNTHCTVLVNDIERYVPELGNLIEPFRFLPDWRIDDLMVSYAEDKGSVGPHTDDYDVFLIQGQGKRRWKIITREDYAQELIPDLPIALLKEFEEDEEWLLNKGDMLYLPPHMPHYGISEGTCFTFSIGFQAPQTQELVKNWLETFSDESKFNKRFTDPDRVLQKNPGEITRKDIASLSTMMMNAIDDQKQNLDIFLGKQLTESRGDVPSNDSAHDDNDDENHEGNQTNQFTFTNKSDYERETWLRFAYIEKESEDANHESSIDFFADGQHISLPIRLKPDIQMLCENYYYQAVDIEDLIDVPAFKTLFKTLIKSGGIYPSE